MFTNTPAFELKGNLLTVMVLRLLDSDNERITIQLADKISKVPNFFRYAPIVIDLQELQNDNNRVNLSQLIETLRYHGLIPVAIRGGNAQHNEIALTMSLGLLPETKLERARHEPTPPAPAATKIVTQPVRSGQQIVAVQGDLIVLSTVSPGAEVLAQRHIHVYGALRGRALAGFNGDIQARIFCQHLDAELVSIAGQYQVSEELSDHLRGKPAQVYLEADELKIESLDPYPR